MGVRSVSADPRPRRRSSAQGRRPSSLSDRVHRAENSLIRSPNTRQWSEFSTAVDADASTAMQHEDSATDNSNDQRSVVSFSSYSSLSTRSEDYFGQDVTQVNVTSQCDEKLRTLQREGAKLRASLRARKIQPSWMAFLVV